MNRRGGEQAETEREVDINVDCDSQERISDCSEEIFSDNGVSLRKLII